jgi:hypothetical protein
VETIRGKTSRELHLTELSEKLNGAEQVLLDLGTGDGHFASRMAAQHRDWFVLGLDACRENLHKISRPNSANLLFVIASAQELPCELAGLVSHVTVNFPWGSLLDCLLSGDPCLMDGLAAVSRPGASIEVRLNAGALMEAGTTLECGAEQIYDHAIRSGWQVNAPVLMDRRAPRTFPSTWAKRLAYGRDARAMTISGKKCNVK